ncbi:formylglycine-generating enzyme family protein [Conyzicola sp.]|uniref:formylglycine-generating enzyme family protein n=1 Tax=Conyzicola sp. TaxID=1969404 RepID=UPI003989A0C4
MVRLPEGSYRMGSVAFYADEGPVHERRVPAFEIDEHPVTNEQFAEFVEATGYTTVAEEPLDAALFPELTADERAPGAMVFTPTSGPVDLRDWRQWWSWVQGARWAEPFGPGSTIDDILDHPVVQVAYRDASAYAAWAGKRLPTEAEWEYAARGGLDGANFAWGDEHDSPADLRANHWQGRFPYLNTGAAGWVGTSPVGTFPPNGFGLYDMTGNTWEWTESPYAPRHILPGAPPPPPLGGRLNLLAEPEPTSPMRVLKGGSHLCAPEYCLRYRPSARSPQSDDTAMTHIGFRCAR